MKKMVIGGLLLAGVMGAKAQRISYGITMNGIGSYLWGKGMQASLQTGYETGAYAEVLLPHKLRLQTGLLYSHRSIRRADDITTYYVNTASSLSRNNITADYITIPVVVSYPLGKYFSVGLGPQYSRLLYTNENLLKSGTDALKKNDAGLKVQAGFRLSGLLLTAGYYYGLTNLNNVDERYTWHTRQLQLGVSIRL
jgi:outer membrane protein assembly factor BamA